MIIELEVQTLQERVTAIEARQRAYTMHDPTCPVFKTMVQQRKTPGVYVMGPPCDCWLST